jgi:hypothetical protein
VNTSTISIVLDGHKCEYIDNFDFLNISIISIAWDGHKCEYIDNFYCFGWT